MRKSVNKHHHAPPNLQDNCFIESSSQVQAAATMVFGKSWLPQNATVHATGNVDKSLLQSPTGAISINQSDNQHQHLHHQFDSYCYAKRLQMHRRKSSIVNQQTGSSSFSRRNSPSPPSTKKSPFPASVNNLVIAPQTVVGTSIYQQNLQQFRNQQSFLQEQQVMIHGVSGNTSGNNNKKSLQNNNTPQKQRNTNSSGLSRKSKNMQRNRKVLRDLLSATSSVSPTSSHQAFGGLVAQHNHPVSATSPKQASKQQMIQNAGGNNNNNNNRSGTQLDTTESFRGEEHSLEIPQPANTPQSQQLTAQQQQQQQQQQKTSNQPQNQMVMLSSNAAHHRTATNQNSMVVTGGEENQTTTPSYYCVEEGGTTVTHQGNQTPPMLQAHSEDKRHDGHHRHRHRKLSGENDDETDMDNHDEMLNEISPTSHHHHHQQNQRLVYLTNTHGQVNDGLSDTTATDLIAAAAAQSNNTTALNSVQAAQDHIRNNSSKQNNDVQQSNQIIKSESFGPLMQINDVAQMQLKNVVGPAGSWAIYANRFGFEPRVTQFSFNSIEQTKLNALEALKENGRQKTASSFNQRPDASNLTSHVPQQQQHQSQQQYVSGAQQPHQQTNEQDMLPQTPLACHNHDLSDLSSFRADCKTAQIGQRRMTKLDSTATSKQKNQMSDLSYKSTKKVTSHAFHSRTQSTINDRGQTNYTSIYDPVLGPLNSYERGGPAALSPHNKHLNNEKKTEMMSTEEFQRQQEIEMARQEQQANSRLVSPSSGQASSKLLASKSKNEISLFMQQPPHTGATSATNQSIAMSNADWRRHEYLLQQLSEYQKKPHIAFMERRSRSKPRTPSTMNDSCNFWGPILPTPDDLNQMQPFAGGPTPHFLLMQRYRKKQIKGTKKQMTNYRPDISLSKLRNPNTAAIDQGVIVSKIDRFDRYVDQHSLKLYILEQKQRESAASQKKLLKETKQLGSRNNIIKIQSQQHQYHNKRPNGAYSTEYKSSNLMSGKHQKMKDLSKQQQYSPHHHRSKTMLNLMKAGNGKPKKTILVKVSSNEALNSNKSEMATRQEDDELISSRKALEKQKSKEQISVNLGGVKVRRANSKEGTLMDEYAHLKESTEQLTLANKTLRPQEEELLEPTIPLKSMDLQAMEDLDDQTTEQRALQPESYIQVIRAAGGIPDEQQQRDRIKLIDQQSNTLKQLRAQRRRSTLQSTQYRTLGNQAPIYERYEQKNSELSQHIRSRKTQFKVQKPNGDKLNLKDGRLHYMLASSPCEGIDDPQLPTNAQDFASNLTSFLAQNQIKQALSGYKGVYNQDKFHMILDELHKRNNPDLYKKMNEGDPKEQVQCSEQYSQQVTAQQAFFSNTDSKTNYQNHLSIAKGQQYHASSQLESESPNSHKQRRMDLQYETETMPGSGIINCQQVNGSAQNVDSM